MHILVTGSTGFLGKAVCSEALNAGHTVVGLTREKADLATLTGAEAAAEIVKNVDGVIHLAAHADFSLNETYKFVRTNVIASTLLAEMCATENKPLVYSSAAVIAPANYITKTTIDQPADGYIMSKLLGEKTILSIKPNASALRIGGIYGKNGPPHLGINNAITTALSGSPTTIFGDGAARRNYIYVKNAAECLIKALTDNWSGIHLIAGHEVLTLMDMLTIISRKLANQEPIIDAKKQSGQDMIIEPSKSQPKTHSFETAILELID